jgi:hypothetical protein
MVSILSLLLIQRETGHHAAYHMDNTLCMLEVALKPWFFTFEWTTKKTVEMVIQGEMWVALYHNFNMPFQVCMFKHSSNVNVSIVIYMPCYFFIFVQLSVYGAILYEVQKLLYVKVCLFY